MRCISCGADNPPSFIYCLQNNVCSACGQQIYNDTTKELMDELANAMEQMPNDPQGIAGWLLSHYRFQKIGDGKPVDQFFGGKGQKKRKIIEEDGGEVVVGDSILDNSVYGREAKKLMEKGAGLSDKLNKARSEKYALMAAAINEFENSDELYGDGSTSNIGDYDEFDNEEGIDGTDLDGETLNALKGSAEGRILMEETLAKKVRAQEAIRAGGGGAFRR